MEKRKGNRLQIFSHRDWYHAVIPHKYDAMQGHTVKFSSNLTFRWFKASYLPTKRNTTHGSKFWQQQKTATWSKLEYHSDYINTRWECKSHGSLPLIHEKCEELRKYSGRLNMGHTHDIYKHLCMEFILGLLAVAPHLKSQHSSYSMKAIPSFQRPVQYEGRWDDRVREWKENEKERKQRTQRKRNRWVGKLIGKISIHVLDKQHICITRKHWRGSAN